VRAALIALALLVPLPGTAAGLEETLRSLEGRPARDAWRTAESLRDEALALDADRALALENLAPELGETGRLALAILLSSRPEPSAKARGQNALEGLARAGRGLDARLAAMRLLEKPHEAESALRALDEIAKGPGDPEARAQACLYAWKIDGKSSHRAPLVEMLELGAAAEREAAALALAESGYTPNSVTSLLEEIRREPSERSARAALLLHLTEHAHTSEEPQEEIRPPPSNGPSAGWVLVLEEALGLIRQHSIHRERLTPGGMVIAALKGMASSLDEYSAFQDPAELRRFEANRLGVEWGLGAQTVKARGAPVVVAKAPYDGPAFKAGIRTGDRILEVNGVTTADKDLEEIQRLTAGPEGAEVKLRIQRFGREGPRELEFILRRSPVEVPLIRVQMFPEGVGYLKLSRFGPRIAADFERALDGLEARGLAALILDLRDNPGGNLDQAIQIADMFLPVMEKPIVTERGPGGSRDRLATAGQKPVHPMVIIVNRLTASSAEVVTGALQDFKRALVVGQRTFGKGVKQVSLPLSEEARKFLGGESRLLITTSTLHLPLGRAIAGEAWGPGRQRARGGLKPDRVVESRHESYEGRQLAELTRIQYSPEVMEYVQSRYDSIKPLYEDGDLWDPSKYPGFEELYLSLGTSLPYDDVRFAVRNLIRRHIEDELGQEFVSDFREDHQLGRAILEALEKMGKDPLSLPEYKSLAEKHAKKE